jgi:hypothetical protein
MVDIKLKSIDETFIYLESVESYIFHQKDNIYCSKATIQIHFTFTALQQSNFPYAMRQFRECGTLFNLKYQSRH